MKEVLLVNEDNMVVGTINLLYNDRPIKDGSIFVLNKVFGDDQMIIGYKITEMDKVLTYG